MANHPYKSLPDKAFWRRSVAQPAMGDVDPVGTFDLRLTPDMKVATAGSCFAQHIARHLQASGFNYYIAEQGHPVLPQNVRDDHGYGLFSARYGNLYTARQLWQLIERAYGRFDPVEAPWIDADGSVRDPFRPTIQPGNFASVEEMLADRAQHLTRVREMFETLDVFVFTLGLTECWESRADGAVFPLCPGVEGGDFDPDQYAFRNQDVGEVLDDMNAFFARLKEINPKAQAILTVSPVPLMATAEPDAQVLAATTYSKSVLRVAAESLRKQHDYIHYFPSFEVITGAYNKGAYYADDLRNVTDAGVNHAMSLVLKYATQGAKTDTNPAKPAPDPDPTDSSADSSTAAAKAFTEVECDEAALDRG